MSRPRQEITEEDRKYLDQAAQLRAEGMSWPRIAAKVGKTMSWLRYRLDDTYNYLSNGPRRGRGHEIIPLTDEELKVRRHVVDVRDLTARMMGDPHIQDRRRPWLLRDAVHPEFPFYRITPSGKVFRNQAMSYHPADSEVFGRIMVSGYRQFKLTDSGGHRRHIRANRLVCEAFWGAPPSPEHQAAHDDGDKLNNSAKNLRWATPKENCDDRKRHGTQIMGSKVGTSVLNEDQVKEILDIYSGYDGEIAELARRYGVGWTTIKNVVDGNTWKHVGDRKREAA